MSELSENALEILRRLVAQNVSAGSGYTTQALISNSFDWVGPEGQKEVEYLFSNGYLEHNTKIRGTFILTELGYRTGCT